MLTLRRWPFVTTAVILVMLWAFLASHETLQRENSRYLQIQSQTFTIAAVHPQAPLTGEQKALIDAFRTNHPQDWEHAALAQAPPANDEDVTAQIRELGTELDDFNRDSLMARFSLYPPHRAKISSLTANFLHRDWTHLLINLFFLWLAGATMERVWGRGWHAVILLVSALLGTLAYFLAYPKELIPLMGASGMLACLMGFYLVRFPKKTIEHGTALWAIRPRLLQFSSPVYEIFPTWMLALAFWGQAAGEPGNQGYIAQGMAFVGGCLAAAVLRFSGLQEHVSQKVEAEMAVSVGEHIALASERLQSGDLDAAITALNAQIAEKPFSVEAHEMLVSLYFRKGNAGIKYLKALESLCDAYLKAAYPEAAWERFEIYLNAGGRRMPAETWLQLARFSENQGNYKRALEEYEALAAEWPNESPSVLALISAGRIHLQHFGRAEDAKKCYLTAQNSSVPHTSWDDMIRKGIEKCGGADPKPVNAQSGKPPA